MTNFRSCRDTTVEFAEHVTLLVGENDAGKSNVIDAIRAATPPVSGRRSLWFERERDLSYGISRDSAVDIQLVYSDLTAAEQGLFIPNLADRDGHLVYTATFDPPSGTRRQRVRYTTGFQRYADPEPENRERIAHVYLPPLRDAVTALDSARGERLHEIFLLLSGDEIESFRESANEALKNLAANPTAQTVVTRVQKHLTSITEPIRHRRVDVLHRDQKLRALLRALRLHMAGVGLEPADLADSGLGYANLLFIATVVMELERASDFDLVLLLVEEPEAHLHPQLQAVLLAYLEEQAELSARDGANATLPTGRIQVVATTHSPQLASSVSTSRLVVIRAEPTMVGQVADPNSTDQARNASPPTDAAKRYPTTTAVALGGVQLSPSERRKVDRYLDATRASLFFARQVMLVEGVAEAVLIRTLAERVVFPSSRDDRDDIDPHNRQKREQFRAISILPIGGVDFLPFLRVLLHDGRAIVDRVVVLTDGDNGQGQRRKMSIGMEFAEHVASGVLKVRVGDTSLELSSTGRCTTSQSSGPPLKSSTQGPLRSGTQSRVARHHRRSEHMHSLKLSATKPWISGRAISRMSSRACSSQLVTISRCRGISGRPSPTRSCQPTNERVPTSSLAAATANL